MITAEHNNVNIRFRCFITSCIGTKQQRIFRIVTRKQLIYSFFNC